MRYVSLCDGIGSVHKAWGPMNWRCVWTSEIEPFPVAVVEAHLPGTINLGDMTQITKGAANQYGRIDLVCGGTPCQSFSVAGLRAGMADPRGNLALVFLRLVDFTRPRWVLWENVPGVLSSNGGRDFGSIIGGLGECGYGFAYRVLDAQYVRVDGLERAVPQRRRRVFVVGHLGDWRRAAAVLFDAESLCGHTPPGREAGKEVAGSFGACAGGGRGFRNDLDSSGAYVPVTGKALGAAGRGVEEPDKADYVVLAHGQAGAEIAEGYCPTLNCNHEQPIVAHCLRGEAADAGEDGTGRGTPMVLVAPAMRTNVYNNSDAGQEAKMPFVFQTRCARNGRGMPDTVAPVLTGAEFGSHADTRPRVFGDDLLGIRRLTPRECERLMGFPDDWTAITFKGKPAADAPRYRALGNSMAVNVMRWLGRRMAMVDGCGA